MGQAPHLQDSSQHTKMHAWEGYTELHVTVTTVGEVAFNYQPHTRVAQRLTAPAAWASPAMNNTPAGSQGTTVAMAV